MPVLAKLAVLPGVDAREASRQGPETLQVNHTAFLGAAETKAAICMCSRSGNPRACWYILQVQNMCWYIAKHCK